MSDEPSRRRANQGPETKGPSFVDNLKKFKAPLIILVIWGGIVGYNVAVGMGAINEVDAGCDDHWHSGFAVVVEGEQVRFMNPAFRSIESPGAGAHLHNEGGDDGLMHFHAGGRCVAVGGLLEKLGVEASGDEIVLAGMHPQAGTYASNETHVAEVYHKPWEGSWNKVSNVGKFMDKPTGDGDQLLIVYREMGEDVGPYQDNVRSLVGDASYEPQSSGPSIGDRFVPIMAVTLIAAVALFVWNNFRQKMN